MSEPPPVNVANLSRKYIDLIRDMSSKWINWDPLNEITVGTYGSVDMAGKFIPEGNIYDPEFQEHMYRHNSGIKMVEYPPHETSVDEMVLLSRRIKRTDLPEDVDPTIANAPLKGKWTYEASKRSAIFVLHKARYTFLQPNVVLEPLYKVDKLMDKCLVTGKYMCPSYLMYLTDKSGGDLTLALKSKATVGETGEADGGLTWLCDDKRDGPRDGLLQCASDETGNPTFTPLFVIKRAIRRNRRFFRDKIRPEPAGDELWYEDQPPWDALDEDGEHDPFDPEVKAVHPFATVDREAAERAAKEKIEEEILEKKRAILRAAGAPY